MGAGHDTLRARAAFRRKLALTALAELDQFTSDQADQHVSKRWTEWERNVSWWHDKSSWLDRPSRVDSILREFVRDGLLEFEVRRVLNKFPLRGQNRTRRVNVYRWKED